MAEAKEKEEKPASREEQAREVEERIRSDYSHELGACEELETFAVGALEPWKGRPIQKSSPQDPPGADEIIALVFARATKTYKAVLHLTRSGYGEQAAMLNRSLFEGMAVAHWAAANEDEAAKRFSRAFAFDQHLLGRVLENTGWLEEGSEVSGPEISEADLAQMRRDFGAYGTKLWTGHPDLRQLVEAIEPDWGTTEERQMLANFMRVANRDNNQMLHATVAGLAEAATGLADDGMYFSVGPSTSRIERALFAAFWSYAQTLRALLERFEFPENEKLDELLESQQFAFRRLSHAEDKAAERNEPCPCGSGLKYKKCHQGRLLAGQVA